MMIDKNRICRWKRVWMKFWIGISWLLIGVTACQDDVPQIVPTTVVYLPETAMPLASPETATPTSASLFVPLLSQNHLTLSPTATPTPVPEPTPTTTPDYPPYNGPTLNRSNIGIQVYLHREDVHQIMRHLQELGVGWVKVQVSWKLHQPAPDRLDSDLFAELDQLIQAAQRDDIAVLLSVSKAPEWSRPITDLDGPPQNYADFRAFMALLALRYRGQVAAYELWNEPNLQREWNGVPLDAAALVSLLRAGAEGVRATDPTALIISAAPAVTGINDGVTAIDDRNYFRAMLNAGVAEVVDGLGVHPYGWANPPEATVAMPDAAATTHNNHPSFFFRDTLMDYGAMLAEFGITDKQLWATEFGWGSFDRFDAAPPPGAEFMTQVSEWQQAIYTQRALELAHDWPWVGPMFLWNLNFAPWIGPDFSESGYSILRPDGSLRPVYLALTALPKR